MTADKKLAHIVLQTGQLPVMRDWYLKVLDALLCTRTRYALRERHENPVVP